VNPIGKTVLAVTGLDAFQRRITRGRAGRALSLRFVAGETLGEAVAVARALNDDGALVSLDHLGEHVTDTAKAQRARDDYLAAIERIHHEGLIANISVKLTQLGLGIDRDLAAASLGALASRARDTGTTVTVDMEESSTVSDTIAIYREAQSDYGNVGVAVQSYLYRTPQDVEDLLPLGGHIRLCKGAYAEPPEVAHQKRFEIDDAFDSLLRTLMASSSAIPAAATHDEQRVALARYLARSRSEPWEFQMLYGVRETLQRELIDAGYRLRIYVPYGDAWYPYLTRRLAERPANLTFFARALVGR